MFILGISCFYHDASACILKDGEITAAAEEERFTRKKHDFSFPINAIRWCLKDSNLKIEDIDYVAFYEKPIIKFERVLHQHLEMFPRSFKTFHQSMPSWLNEKLKIQRIIRKKLKYKGLIHYIPHHLAHAASTFLVSPFEKATILTVDGVGEWTTTAHGFGDGTNIDLIEELKFPHSIGLLYSTITAYLGFTVNNSEYKVMGLAPYGDMDRATNKYYRLLKEVIDLKEDGSFKLNIDYFIFHYSNKMPAEKLCSLLGGPIRKPEAGVEKRHKDIAAAVQLITEDVITKTLNYIHKKTKCDNLVFSGGVGLNSVLNGKILRKTPFKRIWMQPNASDGGTSIGAAAFVYHSIFKNERRHIQKTAYLGPKFSTEEIKSFLDKNNIRYQELKDENEIIRLASKFIFEDNVVGWFHGRMEWGPRALGSRSILANPCNPQAKELLNSKVKHREKFRPFAPVVCEDDAPLYFECDNPIPDPTDFMLMVYPIKKNWHNKIPSVTHVDGSGRLQTIRRYQNPLYYDLIKEFGKLSGIPILINTSFNIRGEPIVCTPFDAYKCMMGTGIDYLIIDKFLIKRSDNPQHMWDSEGSAMD